MAGNSTFHGLRALAARAGIKMRGSVDPAPVEDVEDTNDAPPADDPGEEGPAGDQGTDGENGPVGERGPDAAEPNEEQADDEEDTTGTAPDGGAEGGNDADAEARPSNPSADFLAGERYGAQQAAGRFAAVLMDDDCRANIGMATDLLAETTMSADKIVAYVKRNKPPKAEERSAAQRLLDTTQKVNLGVDADSKKTGADAGKNARKTATASVNQHVGRKAGGNVRRSRRAAAASKEN